MTVNDLFPDVQEILGACDDDQIFRKVTDAVEVLANESGGLWNPLIGYLEMTVQDGGLLVLPADVEAPLRINLDDNPAFARDRLYEFMPGGPGSDAADRQAVSWEDRGLTPLLRVIAPASSIRFRLSAAGVTVAVVGYDANNQRVTSTLNTTTLDVQAFARVESVSKISGGAVTLYGTPSGGGDEEVYAQLVANQSSANYRAIRISPSAAAVRMMYRRKTWKISSRNDYIPLHSRMAVLFMLKALKRGLLEDFNDSAQALQNKAVEFLTKKESVQQAADALAQGQQIAPMLGTTISARDVIRVADIYDDAAAVLGPVGMPKVFDALTQAVDTLANRGQWDSQVVFVDVTTQDGFVFALPDEVGDVLAVNVCGQPAMPRNRWIEYHLNGPGEFDPCCRLNGGSCGDGGYFCGGMPENGSGNEEDSMSYFRARTINNDNVTVTSASVQIAQARTVDRLVGVTNNGTATVYLRIGGAATAGTGEVLLGKGSYYETPAPTTLAIFAACDSGQSSPIHFTEYLP